ncbi:MAG: HAMP domain-containing histidine kinase [Firmicutes bacterium]|nr:HAMP domain-containing histidine kinase [Bacillota bacterium]
MLIACILLGAALAAALVWALLIKRDIKRLARRLGEIAYIDTNARLTTDTFDRDVIALLRGVNAMLERNRRDLFEKVRAETDLKRAITNISHDLRTPLTSAAGYLQMLESSAPDSDTRARYLAIIRGRLEALSALMNGLFEFARVTEGSLALDIRPVNVCNALRDALSGCFAELESKGFAVEADIPDAPVLCLCDEDALRRVLQNLIRNACVHGREYLRVRVAGPIIEIANRADGLDELDTARVFERFYTVDAARTSRNTGLGLAIAKELCTRMRGRIIADVEGGLFVVRMTLPAR